MAIHDLSSRRRADGVSQPRMTGDRSAPGHGWWLVAAVIGTLATLMWWLAGQTPPASPDAALGPVFPAGAGGRTAPSPWLNPNLGIDEDEPVLPSATPAVPAPVMAASPADKVFAVDQAGNLVLDEPMRLRLENLVVLSPEDQLSARVEAQVAHLPPKAAAAARELVSRYEGYMSAQKLSSSSVQAPLLPQEGLAELAELRALRQSYFGQAAAQRLFGKEEQVVQRLLELMMDDPVPDAPMAEKALRAQARYDEER